MRLQIVRGNGRCRVVATRSRLLMWLGQGAALVERTRTAYARECVRECVCDGG